MARKSNLSPIDQRRTQIERELERIRMPKNLKTRRDFSSDEAFGKWQERLEQKLSELAEESLMLDFPEAYAEIPLAVAAVELGMTINELLGVVRQGLLELSFKSILQEGARISRDELSRAIETGAPELLRIADQNLGDIFSEGLCHLHIGNIEAAEKTLERMERFNDYSCPYTTVYQTGVEFIQGDFAAVMSSIEHVGSSDIEDIASLLHPLKPWPKCSP